MESVQSTIFQAPVFKSWFFEKLNFFLSNFDFLMWIFNWIKFLLKNIQRKIVFFFFWYFSIFWHRIWFKSRFKSSLKNQFSIDFSISDFQKLIWKIEKSKNRVRKKSKVRNLFNRIFFKLRFSKADRSKNWFFFFRFWYFLFKNTPKKKIVNWFLNF